MPRTLLPTDRAVLMTSTVHAALLVELERLRAEQAAAGPIGARLPDPLAAGLERTDQIVLLELALGRSVIAHPGDDGYGLAAVGTTVEVDDGKRHCRYRIVLGVGATERDDSSPVSAFSPVGAALMGRAVGESVTVELPDRRSRSLVVRSIQADE